MKKKKMLNQTTATLLLSSIALASCTKNYSTTQYGSGSDSVSTQQASTVVATKDAKADMTAWKKLITSDQKNVALAEILASTVAKENRAGITELVMNLNDDDIKKIIDTVQVERIALGKSYLFRGNPTLEASPIYLNSIASEGSVKAGNFDAESLQLYTATVGYIKSKALSDIYASFDNMMADYTTYIARAISVDIAQNNPVLANELETAAQNSDSKEDFTEKLKSSPNYMSAAAKYLNESDLNSKEQAVLLSAALVSGGIFLELKQTKTFAEIMKKYQDLKPKIDEAKEKYKAVKAAVAAMKKDRDEAAQSLKDFNEGLSGIKNAVKDAYDSAKNESDTVSGKKIGDFLYNKVIKGKETEPKQMSEAALKTQKAIQDNMVKTFTAAGKMADNFSNVLNTFTALTDKLNIKLPKDLQKAIGTATKVASTVKAVSTIVAGFASGGVLAGVSLLASSPLGSMLGLGGGPDPAIMAALGRIEAKLDQVLANQQKMMEMQIETIKMIKNLAVMIDEYHQQEMMALAELRDYSLVNMEMQKTVLNQGIRNCEAMIDYKLKAYWGAGQYIQKSRNGSTTTAIDFEKFYSQFNSLEDYKVFARSSAENNYSKCQEAFADAFGSDSSEESPIRSIYSTNESDNLSAFQRDKYLPLVKLFDKYNGKNGMDKKILHFPSKSISFLDNKAAELATPATQTVQDGFTYNMDNLLSPKSLERYLSSLLILYPIFEFDKSDWNQTLPELVDTYFKQLAAESVTLNPENSNISRGYYFVNNALDMIHSAIAQEALLSGEVLIPSLRAELARGIFKNDTCANATAELMKGKLQDLEYSTGDTGVVCSLRKNNLLMKNYLTYTIQKSITFMNTLDKYKTALAQKDTAALANYFPSEGITKDMLIVSGDDVKIHIPLEEGKFTDLTLPKAEAVSDDTMVYSENMEKLLKMQKDTISALAKLSPSQFRTQESREKFAQLLLYKHY